MQTINKSFPSGAAIALPGGDWARSQCLSRDRMKTDLDHLPQAKQRELERVVQILFEEFGEATALATQGWKKAGKILKIIVNQLPDNWSAKISPTQRLKEIDATSVR